MSHRNKKRITVAVVMLVILLCVAMFFFAPDDTTDIGSPVLVQSKNNWHAQTYVLGGTLLTPDNSFATTKELEFKQAAHLEGDKEAFNQYVKVLKTELRSDDGNYEVYSHTSIDGTNAVHGVHFFNYCVKAGEEDPIAKDYYSHISANKEQIDVPLTMRGNVFIEDGTYTFVWVFWADSEADIRNEAQKYKKVTTTVLARDTFGDYKQLENSGEGTGSL